MTDPADSSSGKKPSGKADKGKLAHSEEPDEEQLPQYDPNAPPGTLVADNETWVPDFLGDVLHIHVDVESLLCVAGSTCAVAYVAGDRRFRPPSIIW